MSGLKATMATVETNTADILAYVSGVRGIHGFAKKHGPRALTFAAGAGMFNPEMRDFLLGFFT